MNCGIRNECDPAMGILSEFVADPNLNHIKMKIAAILGSVLLCVVEYLYFLKFYQQRISKAPRDVQFLRNLGLGLRKLEFSHIA